MRTQNSRTENRSGVGQEIIRSSVTPFITLLK